MIKIEKSIYDKPEPSDGRRILVMRLWPRGISKGKVDIWMKDLGTERELIRKWKDGKISWDKFAAEYNKSLRGKEDLLRSLAEESKAGTITLLCADRDPNRCHRSLLKRAIQEQLG
jgi:uncharacterized protein YeaO (DUF488 family)